MLCITCARVVSARWVLDVSVASSADQVVMKRAALIHDAAPACSRHVRILTCGAWVVIARTALPWQAMICAAIDRPDLASAAQLQLHTSGSSQPYAPAPLHPSGCTLHVACCMLHAVADGTRALFPTGCSLSSTAATACAAGVRLWCPLASFSWPRGATADDVAPAQGTPTTVGRRRRRRRREP